MTTVRSAAGQIGRRGERLVDSAGIAVSSALDERADLDGAPGPGRRDPRCELDRSIEVVGFVGEVAVDASVVGAKHPSVVSVLPFWTRTMVAISGGWSWLPEVTPGVWLIARARMRLRQSALDGLAQTCFSRVSTYHN